MVCTHPLPQYPSPHYIWFGVMTGTPQYNWPHACAGRWRGSWRRRVTQKDDDGDENRWSVPRSSVISVLLNYESKFQQQNRPAAAARSAPVYGATRSALSGLSLVSAPHLLLSQFYKRLDTNVQSRARQQVLITMIASNFRPALCWFSWIWTLGLWLTLKGNLPPPATPPDQSFTQEFS